jgi:hypothetical protein
VSIRGGHPVCLGSADVDVKKLGIAIGVIFALFFVISQPQGSADFILDILGLLEDAAGSVVLFLRSLFS